MAALSQKIKVSKLRKLGQAHEKGNYLQFLKGVQEDGELPDSLSTVMDLYNNEVGFDYGQTHKHATLEQLATEILKAINQGHLKVIKRDKNGNYLNCDNQILNLETLHSQWRNEKCLVSSKNQ